MTLLRQIQDAATEDSAPVASVLRKCKILASRLNHPAFAEWVEWELNGYPNADLVPSYRRLTGLQVLATYTGPGGSSARNLPVPRIVVDEQDREALFSHVFVQGVAEFDDLLASTAQDTLQSPWVAEAVIKYQDKVMDLMTMISAHRVIPRAAVAGLLSSVRNRVLSFALEIEAENPSAGEAPPGSEPVAEEKLNQAFYTIIQGGQAVIQMGGRDMGEVTQLALRKWEGLKSDLERLGLGELEIRELAAAIQADAESIKRGQPGPATEQWIGRITTRIQTGALRLTSDATGSVIAGLVLKALGVA